MVPATASYISSGAFGKTTDVFDALNARIHDPFRREFLQLDLQLTGNVTTFVAGTAVDYTSGYDVIVNIGGDNYSIGDPVDANDLEARLNNLDIGQWYFDADDNLAIRSLHNIGDITQNGNTIFSTSSVVDNIDEPEITDAIRELALRIHKLSTTVALPWTEIGFGSIDNTAIVSSPKLTYNDLTDTLTMTDVHGIDSLKIAPGIFYPFANNGWDAGITLYKNTSGGQFVAGATDSDSTFALWQSFHLSDDLTTQYITEAMLWSCGTYDRGITGNELGTHFKINDYDRIYINDTYVRLYNADPSSSAAYVQRFYGAYTAGIPHYVGLQASNSVAADSTYILPTNYPGVSGYVLSSTTFGVMSWIAPATGSVTSVSVATANGFAGSSSGGATPILTLSTTITGILKGNGTAISAATDLDITGKLLTGYVSGAGTVAATDSILQGIQKLNGNTAALVTGVSSVNGGTGAVTITVTGTANKIDVSGGTGLTPTITISPTYVGQTSITTLGTVTTGTWSATTIGTTKGGTGLTSYTTGDIIYASASNTLSKLAVGTTGQVLTLAAGIPSWATPTTGTVTSIATAGLISGGTINTTGTITTAIATNKLVGRATAGTGVFEAITLGTGLSFSGTTLNVTFPADYISSIADTATIDLSVSGGGQLTASFVSLDISQFANDVPYANLAGIDKQIIFNDGGSAYNGDAGLQYSKTDTQILLANGSDKNPSYAFVSDVGSGMYSNGANGIVLATNGINAWQIDSSQTLFPMGGQSLGLNTNPISKAYVDLINAVGNDGVTGSGNTITTIGGVVTGISNAVVATIVADNDLTGQTTAVANITTYTPGADGTYRVGGYLTTTAISAGTLNFQVTYTDETSVTRTQTFAIMGTTTQNITTTGSFTFPDIQIRVKSGSAITVKTTFVGVSTTYDVGATIEFLR